MPKLYHRQGIRFEYPDSWTIDEDAGESVAVYSPTGAFWLVTRQPDEPDLETLADEALEAMQAEYAELESDPVEEIIAGREAIGYDLSFWYLDLVSTASIRCVATSDASYVVMCQAEDREFESMSPVFLAITVSLLAAD